MSSNYPAGFDQLPLPSSNQKVNSTETLTHSELHTRVAEAILAIQTTLGINPQGSYDTVAERLGFGGGAGDEVIDNSITNAKLADMTAPSIKGRITSGSGDPENLNPADVTSMLEIFTSVLKGLVPASGGGTANFLRADGTWAAPPGGSLADGDKGDVTVSASGATWTIDTDVVTNGKLANMAQSTIKGRAVGAGTGDPTDLTSAQATAIIDTFTTGLKGLAPASGGGTTNFLRADGTWAAPVDGSGGIGPEVFIVASNTAHATIKARADYVCDGVDDQVEINAALALGSVQLTDGDYTLGSNTPILITKPGTSLRGTGKADDMGVNGGRGFGTIIKAVAGFNGEAQILVDQTGGYIVGMVNISDMTIDGTGITSTTVDGIKIKSFQGNIRNIFVESARQHGIHMLGNVAPDPDWSTYDTIITECYAARCGGAGLYIGGDGADLHVSQCIFLHNTGAGIEYAGGSSGQFTQIHCYSNQYGIWYHDAAGTRTKFANCKIEHSEQHGIYHDGSGGVGNAAWVQYVNCGFNANGELTNNTYDHINITGSSAATKLQFIGCHFGNADNPSNLARYCINLGTAGTGALILGCYFGWASGALANAGVATGLVNIGNETTRRGTTISGCVGIDDWHGTDGATTAAAGANAGTSPPAPVVVADSTDRTGRITFGTGSGATAGPMVTVTFNRTKFPANQRVQLTASNLATATAIPYVHSVSSTSFSIGLSTVSPSQPNTFYSVDYSVVG